MAADESDPDPSPWDVLASDYLSRRPWMTLRRDRVRLPNGAEIDEYFVLEYPDWINVVALTDDGKVVLVRQYRHGIRAVHYELPAGVCDPADPDPLVTARRELLEETGYGGGEWSPLLVLSANPGTHSNRTHSFLARGVTLLARPEPEATEDLRIHLVTPAEARAIALGGGMAQALHVAPLLKALMVEPPGG